MMQPSITRLTFIKTGSVTHSLDMSTDMLDLSFTHGPDNTLIVTVPDNANVLAPGNWMLFAFNDQGTPSVAATISVGLGGEDFSPRRSRLRDRIGRCDLRRRFRRLHVDAERGEQDRRGHV